MGWLRLVRSFKLQGSFAEYNLFYRSLLQRETYNFKEPTNRSHPICVSYTPTRKHSHECGAKKFDVCVYLENHSLLKAIEPKNTRIHTLHIHIRIRIRMLRGLWWYDHLFENMLIHTHTHIHTNTHTHTRARAQGLVYEKHTCAP